MDSQLEIFKAAVAHENTGKILYYAKFSPAIAEKLKSSYHLDEQRDLGDFFGMYQPVHISPGRRQDRPAPDFSRYYSGIGITEGGTIDDMGILKLPGSSYHFTHIVSPLRHAKSIEDIISFPNTIDPADFDYSQMAAEAAKAHAQGMVAICWVGRLYETSWPVRGYEDFLVDMAINPDWSDVLLDRNTEWNINLSREAAKAGIDVLYFGDDVGNQRALMFSPDTWRSVLKPRWEKIIAAARRIRKDIAVWYHSDGNITDILDDLVDVGINILNPVQPECMDIWELKRRYGKYLLIDGGIGTQTVMPFGSPDDVRREVKQLVERAGCDGGLILSPSHTLEPEVPIENIAAFFESAKIYGGWN